MYYHLPIHSLSTLVENDVTIFLDINILTRSVFLFQIQDKLNYMNEICLRSDMHLSVDGRDLEGEDLTLRELNVQEGDVLMLRVSLQI